MSLQYTNLEEDGVLVVGKGKTWGTSGAVAVLLSLPEKQESGKRTYNHLSTCFCVKTA
jgi:hypothetical protein